MTLATLIDRVPMMAVPCRANRGAARIEQVVEDWAMQTGLAAGSGEDARLRAARFGWLAGHTFAESTVEEAALFGQWLAWLFALDDLQDDIDAPAHVIDEIYADVLSADPSTAVGRAFACLWRQTSPILGPGWRARFRQHLWQHRHAGLLQACHRQAGYVPLPGQYAQMRRHSNAPFVFDLPEAVLRTEIPLHLVATLQWQTLFDGCNDIVAWCNDIASLGKELAVGVTHNYVLAIAHHENRSVADATAIVLDRIVARFAQLRVAAMEFPQVCVASGLDRATTSYACRVAAALLTLPRAHLDWLLMSPRYRP